MAENANIAARAIKQINTRLGEVIKKKELNVHVLILRARSCALAGDACVRATH